MGRAIGFIIVLWGINVFFGQVTIQLERTLVAGFQTLETAAVVAELQLTKI